MFVLNVMFVQGLIIWVNVLFGYLFVQIKGVGVGGEWIQDIIQCYKVYVELYNLDIIFILVGYNDLNNVVNVGVQKGIGILYVVDFMQIWLMSVIV